MRQRFVLAVAALACALAAGACGEAPDPELQPDALLRDSLGLGDDDRVHTVRMSAGNGGERLDPARIQARPGDLVQFVMADPRPRTVSFPDDSLDAGAAAFLRDLGQQASPPLVEGEARFVVSFRDAPEGRYPFLVEGTGGVVGGVVVVASPEGRR